MAALPKITVEVTGLNASATFEALIDTGFSGDLCIPVKDAEKLGLIFAGHEKFELANGQWITQFYFKGRVRFLGRTQDAQILVSDSEVAQLGLSLLADYRLTIDFSANKVNLTRKRN
jgi:clan AA aspartic protease